MERYALNETALSGFATLYGGGVAAQVLSATAVPSLGIYARPAVAAMAIAATGTGMRATLGKGAADLAMSGVGRCHLIIRAIAGAASMALSTLADGRMALVARGAAVMALNATGNAIKATLAAGFAQLGLDAPARSTLAARGRGLADLILTGGAGIPRPKRVPDTFSQAHASRRILVEPEHGAFAPAVLERTTTVPFEDRTIHVALERDS